MIANFPYDYGLSAQSSGSGIFSCGETKASYYKIQNAEIPFLYADIDSEVVCPGPTMTEVAQSNSEQGSPGWQFAPLLDAKVCSGNLCCLARDFEGSTDGYALAALDGQDSGCNDYSYGANCNKASLNWLGQACGVYAGSADSTALHYKQPTGNLKRVRLEMMVSPATAVYPHVFADGRHTGGSEQELLAPGEGLKFFQTGTSAVLLVNSSHPLTVASMYGRPYHSDRARLLYTCPSTTSTSTPTIDATTPIDASRLAIIPSCLAMLVSLSFFFVECL